MNWCRDTQRTDMKNRIERNRQTGSVLIQIADRGMFWNFQLRTEYMALASALLQPDDKRVQFCFDTGSQLWQPSIVPVQFLMSKSPYSNFLKRRVFAIIPSVAFSNALISLSSWAKDNAAIFVGRKNIP